MRNTTKEIRNCIKLVGQNIHKIRQEKKLTLQKISCEANIHPHTLDQYELGKNDMCLRDLVKIAIALDVKPELFLQFET